MKNIYRVLLLSAVLFFTACGSSSSNDEASNTNVNVQNALSGKILYYTEDGVPKTVHFNNDMSLMTVTEDSVIVQETNILRIDGNKIYLEGDEVGIYLFVEEITDTYVALRKGTDSLGLEGGIPATLTYFNINDVPQS